MVSGKSKNLLRVQYSCNTCMEFEKDIISCINVMNEGGIILYPTDTVWGIGCDATNEAAVSKIFRLKKRQDEKSMIVLVAEEKDVLQYTASTDLAVFDYLQKTSKPTTVIYDGAIGLAANLVAADGSVGIRICKDIFCRHLVKRFRKPIVSTSANISGEPTAASFAAITAAIKNGVDYIVHYRQDDLKPAQPSSVIRWKDGEIVVLRP